ncbi:type III secretion system export apparatus subunit SctS [Telmatospirillum sp. J64-1]|uniref:type III secretion system export apparatus subunit SctS n=1 Tax=Telmatospirillum sp. J64-1 TaxID=2502183 RepID=UPI00115D6B3B|nr:type III secretion system export apparatus subunit SctS [Telmatospirillum sp. J64-1]
MNEADIVGYLARGLILVLLLSLPPIIVASVVGTLVSLLQALTQVQEQTLSFGFKLVAVGVTIFITAPWLGGELYRYTLTLFTTFHEVVR